MPIPVSTTSYITTVFIQDSSSTTGAGLAGLLYNTSGLTCYYKRSNGTASVAVSLADISTLGTFVSGGFKAIDGTNMPGLYEFDPPDAALTSGATNVTFYFQGAANMAATVLGMDLAAAALTGAQIATAVWQDATAGDFTTASSIGKSLYIANVAPGGAGGHMISGSNAGTTTLAALTITGATLHTGTTTYTGAVLYSNGITPLMIRTSVAQAGNATSITLDAGASATTDLYKGETIHILSGSGASQTRTIIGYNGSTKIATVDRNWVTNPSNTSVFVIWPTDSPALNTTLQVSANVSQVTILSGTAQAGSTANTIVLAAAGSGTNSIYVSDLVTITGGTGVGQSRTIIAYNGTSKVATVDRNWNVTPDNTSTFNVLASNTPSTFSDQGVAQAGGSSTITLQSTASAVDEFYTGSLVTILSGTGSGQTRTITAYTGSTKGATVDAAWSVNPDSTSGYAVIPAASADQSLTNVNVSTINGQTTNIDGNGNFVCVLADGVAHGGVPGSSTATFAMQTMELNPGPSESGFKIAGGAVGIDWSGTDGGYIQSTDVNGGAWTIGGSSGAAWQLQSGPSGASAVIDIVAQTDGSGIRISAAGTNKHGLEVTGGSTSGDAFHLTAIDGSGIKAVGGSGKPAIVPGSLALGL